MKIHTKIIILTFFLPLALLSETARLDDFVFEYSEEDISFQTIPGKGEAKFLCLWNGDDLDSYLATGRVQNASSEKSSLKTMIATMEANGAQKVKSKKLEEIESTSGRVFQTWRLNYLRGGKPQTQLFYATKDDGFIVISIVSIVRPEDWEKTKARTDELIRNSKIEVQNK